MAAKDGPEACELLSDDTASELEKQEKKPCEAAITSLPVSGSRVSHVESAELSAIATVPGGGVLFLGKTPDGWRIAAAVCNERPSEPYDCELSG